MAKSKPVPGTLYVNLGGGQIPADYQEIDGVQFIPDVSAPPAKGAKFMLAATGSKGEQLAVRVVSSNPETGSATLGIARTDSEKPWSGIASIKVVAVYTEGSLLGIGSEPVRAMAKPSTNGARAQAARKAPTPQARPARNASTKKGKGK